ncbi:MULTISPECIES: phosphoglucomutase/phosphomannomutase family protein [Chloracidobacterium]|jgi:phosphomannomutase|uniref:Phosphomannomutase n=2 Tax=Chloracidobacterium TaxID=458032 RepID=G2LF66_CHLTF|nr:MULTISPECIES: phosphoglucomutase/phosphomannomutase family protein [Chloracidobacterium]AEP12994.1 Phosphomannomutase [Chloracidobacterium thermophilum B]QUV78706.1 phosphoglucomutase/phosphomannomutase family protein [Chloracidobacterium thermophilum]QUV81754.1 phosphoglucomutase/phosphomannomutase family protein [Chloracidobacterium sp. D]QUV83758.1 phosphoglucomutase/phosphomannomutase family protein [Chloracidobacterium sp. 2]QUV87762.1 phosphoglucomutase/phosphomannomutase family prote
MTTIKFGTDGWRGRIAREFTFANLDRVAQATAEQFLADADGTAPLVYVGHDRRFLGEDFAARVAEVMAGNGFQVRVYDQFVPTPMVSYDCYAERARGGIVITASHNPPQFSGFKIKLPFGGSAPPEYTLQVEARLDANPPRTTGLRAALASGQVQYVPPSARYLARIGELLDLDRLRAFDGEVLVDSMYGAGGRYIEQLLQGGRLRVTTLRAERDPYFGGIHPEPMMPQLQPLCDEVVRRRAFLGLATDGDADRIGAVDDTGAYLNTHRMLAILALYLIRKRGLTGGIARTVSQSVVVKRIAERHGLPTYETPVGFKHIAALMRTHDILCGGEESNGLGCKLHIPERDGIFSGLLFLEAILAFGRKPSELVADISEEFGFFAYDRRDLALDHIEQGLAFIERLKADPPAAVAGYPVREVGLLDGVKLHFEDESWLLFRASGTEPLVRVYSEATTVEKMSALLAFGEQLVHESL